MIERMVLHGLTDKEIMNLIECSRSLIYNVRKAIAQHISVNLQHKE